jgi:hypothetical protein
MKLIKGEINNNIALSLAEKTTITDAYYLFCFQSDQTKLKYYLIPTDLSTTEQRKRFNKFTITEGIDNPLNGSIILGLAGRYHYTIYEQDNDTNLDPAGLNIVERGIMNLKGDLPTRYVAYDNNVTYTVYE